MKKTADKS